MSKAEFEKFLSAPSIDADRGAFDLAYKSFSSYVGRAYPYANIKAIVGISAADGSTSISVVNSVSPEINFIHFCNDVVDSVILNGKTYEVTISYYVSDKIIGSMQKPVNGCPNLVGSGNV